jgi:hypothetical protein
MVSNKPPEHGILDWTDTYNNKGSGKGMQDNNLYIKVNQDSILLIEVYVDDIIFGSDDDRMSQNFQRICKMSSNVIDLENYLSFWVFRYVKETKEFLSLRPSISEKC